MLFEAAAVLMGFLCYREYSDLVSGHGIQRPGVFFNATQSTVFYTPDQSRPAFRQDLLNSDGVRLTWQINQKNKLNAQAEPQRNCVCRGRGLNRTRIF